MRMRSRCRGRWWLILFLNNNIGCDHRLVVSYWFWDNHRFDFLGSRFGYWLVFLDNHR